MLGLQAQQQQHGASKAQAKGQHKPAVPSEQARQESLAWATAKLTQPEEATADHWLQQLRYCTGPGRQG